MSGGAEGTIIVNLTDEVDPAHSAPLLDWNQPWLEEEYDWTPDDGALITDPPPRIPDPSDPFDTMTFEDAPDVSASINLITHSSFENVVDWSVGAGWTVPYATADALYGKSVARIVCAGHGGELSTSDPISVDRSRTYWASFESRMPSYTSGGGAMVLREYDADDLLLRESVIASQSALNASWRRYSRRVTGLMQYAGDLVWHLETDHVRFAFVPSGPPTFEWEIDAAMFALGSVDASWNARPGEDIPGSQIIPGSMPDTAFASGIDPVLVFDTLPDASLYPHRLAVWTVDHKLYVSDGVEWAVVIHEPDLTALPTGIEPVSTLPELPNPTYMPGTFVYYSVDGKLYRNVGDVWTKAVDPVDVTGLAAYVTAHGGIASVNPKPTLPDAAYPVGTVVFDSADGKLYRNVADAWTSVVDPVDVSGLPAYIAAHGGIAGVHPLPTLPDAAYPVGTVVFETSDGKLYRNVANVWTAAVPTADLTGTISTTQIAANAITTAKFASGITPIEILSSLPAAGSQGRTVFLTTDSKLYRDTGAAWTAVVPTTDLTGTITTVQIDPAAVTHAKLAVDAVQADVILAGTITATQLGSSAVTHAKLAVDAVQADVILAATITATQIANNAITTPLLNAGAVTTAKIAAGAVTATEIAANTITAAKIFAGTITATELASDSVTTVKILANAVTAAKVATDTLTANEIAASAISTSELAAGAVTAAKITAGTITTNEIASLTIVAGNIAAATITGAKIAAATIDASNIVADSLTAGQIAASAISTSELAALAVTAAKIAANTITASQIAAGTITTTEIAATTILAGNIAAGTITSTQVATDTLLAGNIAANAIGTSELNALAVTAAKIAANTITAGQIAAGTITATEVATDTLLAGNIAANAVSTSELNALAVTAAKIAANTITAAQIFAGTITTNEIATGTIVAANIASHTITAAVIAAGTITTTEIAATTILAGNVATDTLTAGQIAASAISTSELNALAVTAAKIAANTITAGQIAANTITAGQIFAGTITATEIASGAITTAKLSVTAAAPQVDNTAGGAVTPTFVFTVDATGVTLKDLGGASVLTGAGFAGSWLSFLQANAYNAVFDSGPTGGNGTNLTTGSAVATTVPNWTLVNVGGTRIQISWRNDATVGRAGQLRFKMLNAGSASDESYVYHDAPIAPAGDNTARAHSFWITGNVTALSAASQFYISAQYLKADETTTTGTEGTYLNTSPFGTLNYLHATPNGGVMPTDAAFLRVKIGIKRGSAGLSATAQIEVYSAQIAPSELYTFFGTGGNMGVITTVAQAPTSQTSGIYIGGWDATSPLTAVGNGMALSGSKATFDVPVTVAGGALTVSGGSVTVSGGNLITTGNTIVGGAMTMSDGLMTFRRDDSATSMANRYYSGASTAGGVAVFSKTRANIIGGTDAAVVAGDTLYSIQFHGMDSASGAYQIAAAVYGLADSTGTVAAGRVDGSLSFRTAQAGTLNEQWVIKTGGNLVATDGNNIQFGTTTGTKIATLATQKFGFWGAAAVAQAALAPSTNVAITAAGATNTVFRNTTFTGGIAGNAYSIGDLVFALKTVGLIP